MCGMPDSIAPEGPRRLPPLVLHPFSTAADAARLLESTRAGLMLRGLVPNTQEEENLLKQLVQGRYCEIRMLFYIGRDLARWIDQCMDSFSRTPELQNSGVKFQSFMALLTENPPPNVAEKMRGWGVADFKRVFSRAIALNSIFEEIPPLAALCPEFVRDYYDYLDQIFACRQSACPYTPLDPAEVAFDVYASGEYSNLLERGLNR
jgi:hypothetical protein